MKYIIVDTNQIFGSFYMQSAKFEALFTYLRKVSGVLCIPEVVKLEAIEKYRAEAKDYLLFRKKNDLNLFPIGDQEEYMEKMLDKINDYSAFWESIESSGLPIKIIKFNKSEGLIDNLIDKAVAQKRPFNRQSDGFRDAVIWQTILDFIEENKSDVKETCFISANIKDFCTSSGDPGLFHKDLTEDLDKQGVSLEHFEDIETFLAEFGDKIPATVPGFLNSCLLNEKTYILDKIQAFLLRVDSKEVVEQFIIPSDMILSGVCADDILDMNIKQYFVYSSDGEWRYVSMKVGVLLLVTATLYPRDITEETAILKNHSIAMERKIKLKVNPKTGESHLLWVD